MRQIEKIAIATLTVITLMFISLVILATRKDDSNNKPISYPEEIQIAKAGDTLIVSSVSDSIYIGFKHK